MSVSDKDVSPSNSDKNDRTLRLVQESKVLQRFALVVQNKLDQLISNENPNIRLQDEERKALLQINNIGLWQGVTAGVVSFVMMRRTRAAFYRRHRLWTQQQQHPGGEPRVVPNNSPFQASSVSRNHSWTENMQQPQPPSFLEPRPGFSFFNIFFLLFDGIVSCTAALAVSLMFTDGNKIMEGIAGLPLIQGKSVVADEFCPVVITEWMRLEREAAAASTNEVQVLDPAPNDHALSGQSAPALPFLSITTASESPYLRAVVDFKDNCLRRQAYERRLRRSSGLDSHAPVAIPPPGVPTGDDPSLLFLQLDGDGSADDKDYTIDEPLPWPDADDSSNWDDSVSPK
jgi:hypothetical protein